MGIAGACSDEGNVKPGIWSIHIGKLHGKVVTRLGSESQTAKGLLLLVLWGWGTELLNFPFAIYAWLLYSVNSRKKSIKLYIEN